MLGVLPFYHSFGMTCIMLAGIRLGNSVVVVPKFELRSCLSYVEKYKVNASVHITDRKQNTTKARTLRML